jgi:uncharacterized lipoprotein NlpE involved in copper resistance
MQLKKLILLTCLPFLFLNCKKEEKSPTSITSDINKDTAITVVEAKVNESHNSQNSLDWQGTYKGVIPCADCEGIETEIVLNADLTFTLKTKYLGKGDGKVFEEKGSFTWDKTGSIIKFKDVKERPSQYEVGENRLIQLDMKGNVITGNLAEKYILTK